MARSRNFIVWTVLGTLLSLILPVVGTAIAGMLFPDFRLTHLPLHSLVEGAGGMIALGIAGILLAEMNRKADASHYPWMAAGFTSMGVLDLFHAAASPGNAFVWLRGVATFSGSVFFGLVWLSAWKPQRPLRPMFPLMVALLTIAFGAVSLLASSHLPAMRTPDEAFSTTAVALNMSSGIGFLAAAAFFGRRGLTIGDAEDWLFAMQATLFGAAGLAFPYSVIWDGGWWWSHLLRLAAYVIALTYGLRTFRDAERELRQVNQQLLQANDTLDRRVCDRTTELQSVNKALQSEVTVRQQTEHALRDSEERSNLALKSSGVGTWSWDVVKNSIFWDDFIHPLFGLEPGTFPGRYEDFLGTLHVDDRDRVTQEVARSVENDAPYDTEYKVVWPNGSVHVLGSRAKVYRDADGRALRMTGVC